MRKFYELTTDDVGKATICAFGKVWFVSDFIGRIFTTDVGKRVVFIPNSYGHHGGHLQVENDQQRMARLAATAELTKRQSRA